ncbi:hypothetical protein ACET8B_02055 [Aeromonas caviae]|uniref:hypothetical protein n=1 Tax=Aeromonas caviae TaxID=648 RepID=UPI0038D06B09
MKKWILGMSLPLLASMSAHAIGINSMLEYTNPKGEASFIITNSEDYRQYVNVLITELVVEHGNIKKVPYTRDNVNKWALASHPARAILEPSFKKTFSMVYQPVTGEPVVNRDKVFQVSFVPTPYFSDAEKKTNTVKMAFGFAPILIVPAKEPQPLNYEMRYQGDKVVVTNKGNSFFTLYLDGCAKNTAAKARSTCSTDATVLAGRTLTIPLSGTMAGQSELRAKLSSHGNKHKAEATLRKQS